VTSVIASGVVRAVQYNSHDGVNSCTLLLLMRGVSWEDGEFSVATYLCKVLVVEDLVGVCVAEDFAGKNVWVVGELIWYEDSLAVKANRIEVLPSPDFTGEGS
jgi:hypothetical protein